MDYTQMILTGEGFPTYPCTNCNEQDVVGLCNCTSLSKYRKEYGEIPSIVHRARKMVESIKSSEDIIKQHQERVSLLKKTLKADWGINL